MITSRPQEVIGRRGKGRHGTFVIHHRTVGLPHNLITWRDDYNKFANDDLSVNDLVANVFFTTLSETMAAERGVQINVAKGGLRCRFGVPVKRTAYFFRDRDFQATVNGARRRIFHHVAAHERVRDGRVQRVAEHYRGVRRFQWRGYQIHLTVPELHHPALSGYAAPTITVDPLIGDQDAMARNTMTMAQAGSLIAGRIWRGGEGPR